MAGLQFCQLLLKLVIGFIQHSIIFCLFCLVQCKSIIQLGKQTEKNENRDFISDKGTNLNMDFFLPVLMQL